MDMYRYTKDGEEPIYIIAEDKFEADEELQEMWHALDGWTREALV
jgi:hypothetical protein